MIPLRARADVGFSLLALVLTASIVVSCVSVTTGEAPEAAAGEREATTPAATASRPSEAPGDDPVGFPAEPTAVSTDVPSAAATAAPTQVARAGGVAPAAIAAVPVTDVTDVAAAAPTTAAATAVTTEAAAATPGVSMPTLAPATVAPTAGAPSVAPTILPPTESPASPTAPPPTAGDASPEARESEAPFAEALDQRTVRRIGRILARTTGKKRVAGLQVAVRLADGQTWTSTAGSAAFSPQRPVRDDTVFSIASVSKTFIAALILQLAEEGELDLDAPYGRYIAEGPRRERVTIRQLLSHTSGIYDYFSNPRYLRAAEAWLRTRPQPGLLARDHTWTFDEIMDLVKPNQYCKPGRCYRYSNTNYVLLGRVAEAVGGAPLDRLLRRRFFRPLGLDDTYYQPADVPPASAAHGHWPSGRRFTDHTRADRLRPFTAAATVAGAAGAIASTARDLTVWADALYGGKILSRSSLAALTDIQPEGTYGLGTDYAVFAGHRAYGHRGGLRGFEASMWYFPDDGVSVALLSNEGNWYLSPARSIDIPMQGIVSAVLGARR